jgi:hypothetical protein
LTENELIIGQISGTIRTVTMENILKNKYERSGQNAISFLEGVSREISCGENVSLSRQKDITSQLP